jgi:nucleoside-diphosphate-sugar epimerase
VYATSSHPADLPHHTVADLAIPSAADTLLEAVGPDAVLHLAGGAGGDRHQLYRRNTLTSVNVTRAAAALPVPPHLVVVGSAAEYGEGGAEPLDESAPLRPLSDYGRAKAAATTLAEVLAVEHGLRLTIARPFNVVSAALPAGTALGHLRAQLLCQSGRQRIVRCGRLDVVRDFVPLHFVTQALVRLSTEDHQGTFNVCSGIGIPLGSILDAMASRLGVDIDVEPDPELSALPAGDRTVGSPAKLAALGLECRPSPGSLAALCMEN